MSHFLIVTQATGGVGKTIVARGFPKAMWNASTLAIRPNKRILESASDRVKAHLGVTRCPVRAERSGSQAARAIDGAAVTVTLPAASVGTPRGWTACRRSRFQPILLPLENPDLHRGILIPTTDRPDIDHAGTDKSSGA